MQEIRRSEYTDEGLPLFSLVSKPKYLEICQFENGLLKTRQVNDTFYHYANNVLLGSSKVGQTVAVNIRGRTRCLIHNKPKHITYTVIDTLFKWLLSIEPGYVSQAVEGAPVFFDDFMNFYRQYQGPYTREEVDMQGFHFSIVNGYPDGDIVNEKLQYRATVTRGIIEEENIGGFRYVYDIAGNVLEAYYNDMQINVDNGIIHHDGIYDDGLLNGIIGDTLFYKGILVAQGIDYNVDQDINTPYGKVLIRKGSANYYLMNVSADVIKDVPINAPITDYQDNIRRLVREILSSLY